MPCQLMYHFSLCHTYYIIFSSKIHSIEWHCLLILLPVVIFLWKIEVSRFSFILTRCLIFVLKLFIITEQMMPSRHIIMSWFSIIKSLFLSKSSLTPTLDGWICKPSFYIIMTLSCSATSKIVLYCTTCDLTLNVFT